MNKSKPKKTKEEPKPRQEPESRGRYVCIYCNHESDYPLNNHNCWQRSVARGH